nr:hypothetical protein GCM10025699_58580 [Microbacterium flavescens]
MSERPENPARYTHGHHESVLRSHTWRTVDNSAAYLVPHLTPGVGVLDVGSGPGTITIDIAARVSPGLVVGIDAAAGVVEQATALAAETGTTNVRFETADLFALPFDDDRFDVVHAHQVLQHVGDPVAALREMRRVTRPGESWRCATSTTTAASGPPRIPACSRGWTSTRPCTAATEESPTPGGASRAGRSRRASSTW